MEANKLGIKVPVLKTRGAVKPGAYYAHFAHWLTRPWFYLVKGCP